MSFAWPQLLWLLLLVPVIVILYILIQRRRRLYALRYASLSMVKDALGKGPGVRRHIPPVLFMAALTFLLFGISRPSAVVPMLSQQGVIILAIDSSGSMRAEDVSPSRMEAAKDAAKTFIENQASGSRIGIVTFAGTASIVQPPTDDRDALFAAIDRLAMQRGTAIGSGIVMSLNAILEDYGDTPLPLQQGLQSGFGGGSGFRSSQPLGGFFSQQEDPGSRTGTSSPPAGSTDLQTAIVVLLSDGQSNTGPLPLDVVDHAVQRNVRIFTIGLGDPDGIIVNFYNRSSRLRLDEATLKEIAERTQAAYFRAGTDTDLREIYENLSTELVIKPEKLEITALFSGLAGIFLVAAATFSLLWFNRLP